MEFDEGRSALAVQSCQPLRLETASPSRICARGGEKAAYEASTPGGGEKAVYDVSKAEHEQLIQIYAIGGKN